MADIIARLKLSSNEFDSKIKRATQGLLQMEQECRKVGGTLAVLEKDQIDYVKSLGNMETVSRTARGRISELSSAYVELAVQYRRLTDEEKKGDYGKALSSSLDQLKTRIADSKKELSDIQQELNATGRESNSTGSILDQLAQKFTINIDALKLFELGMKAVNVAVDVAKDAFLANEQQLDEWGAIVESSESLYKGFLNALNTGDINGYLNNINQIVRAATSAYNALDALGTFNAFNQVNVEKTRTNMTESIVDYREGKGDKKSVRAAGDAYKKELEERRRLEQQAYIEAIGKVAAERGVNKQDLIDALSGSYGHYQDLKNVQPTGTVTKYSPGIMPGSQGTYTTYTVAQNKQEKLGEALRQLNDTELQSLQALGAQAQRTGNEIAQVDRQLVRVLNGRQGGGGKIGGGGGGKTAPTWAPIEMQALAGLSFGRSVNDVQADISRAQKAYNSAEDAAGRAAAQTMLDKRNAELAGIKNEGNLFADAYAYDFRKAKVEEKNDDEEEKKKEDKQAVKMTDVLGDVSGGIGQMVGGLEQLGVDIPEGLKSVVSGITTVTSILSAIATIVMAIQAISAADAIIPFAHGGLVGKAAGGMLIPGNNFSGDNLRMPLMGGRGMIGVNSGELILNRSQQDSIAQQLSVDTGRTATSQPYVSGEMVYLAVNNFLRRTGKGEILTAKN